MTLEFTEGDIHGTINLFKEVHLFWSDDFRVERQSCTWNDKQSTR